MSWAGTISIIIAAGTVVSSLQSDRLTIKLSDSQMIRLGQAVAAAGIVAMLLPVYLLVILAVMAAMHEALLRKGEKQHEMR